MTWPCCVLARSDILLRCRNRFCHHHDVPNSLLTLWLAVTSLAFSASVKLEIGTPSAIRSYIQTTIAASASDGRAAVTPCGRAFFLAAPLDESQAFRSRATSRRQPYTSLRRMAAALPESRGKKFAVVAATSPLASRYSATFSFSFAKNA